MIGGLSVSSNDGYNENLSSRALRRARIDLIFTDYEVGSGAARTAHLQWQYHVELFVTTGN